MAATTEPAAGSTQVQELTWALGEVHLRREDLESEAAPAPEPAPGAPGFADYFTEWQAPDPV